MLEEFLAETDPKSLFEGVCDMPPHSRWLTCILS